MGLNITTARMCSLGYAIKKEKKQTKQNKGEIRHGTVQRALPGRLRETRARVKENNKNERVYSWQKSVFTDWGLRCVRFHYFEA
jgi:hypothetical protein